MLGFLRFWLGRVRWLGQVSTGWNMMGLIEACCDEL
jgi:hypothetical protein